MRTGKKEDARVTMIESEYERLRSAKECKGVRTIVNEPEQGRTSKNEQQLTRARGNE